VSSETKKILLIGAKGYDRAKEGLRVNCVTWDKISTISNVRDYDVLVINLLSIKTTAERKKVNWEKFNKLLDFHATSDIISHEGEIIIVGDPRFKILDELIAKEFLDWTGATFIWDGEPGDTIKSNNLNQFKNYEKHLRTWNYSLASCSLNRITFNERWNLQNIENRGRVVQTRLQAACFNRYRQALAFFIEHIITDGNRIFSQFGRIYILPEISLDEDETLLIVLRDFCDAASELPEPEWVASFNVPGQKPIDEKIALIKTTLAEQETALEKALVERTAARTCLKLLYEREFALEPVVRNILRQLGAKVEEPTENNKEDGWLTIQIAGTIYEGVLEIKSTKNDQFGEDGRKQLLDWIDRGRTLRHKEYKGIFIGNSAVAKPIKDRPNAFSDSWGKATSLSKICAIKSEELYYIYLLHKRGEMNLDDFWTKLFTTNGIFDIKPLLPKKKTDHS
jgi:hypothetical protein